MVGQNPLNLISLVIDMDHVEIERAWVLDALPPEKIVKYKIPHDIGYIFADDECELRIVQRYHRVENGMLEDARKYSITVKDGAGGLSRKEWEDDEFPAWAFDLLWTKLCCSLYKTRHFVDYKDNLLEIDEYHDRTFYSGNYAYDDSLAGKVRLECEFDSEDAAKSFELPEWAKGAVEVTQDSRFRNKNIAQLGWPK